MKREQVEELLRLAEAVSPGELVCESDYLYVSDPEFKMNSHHGKRGVQIGALSYSSDRALFAAARNNVPAICRALLDAMDREAGVLAYCAKISPDELDDYEACDVARKVEEILRGEA